MRYGRKFVATILALLMYSTSVFAEETTTKTFQATTDGENISVVETDLYSDVDNSNLPVKVIRQIGEQSTTIYEGLLSGYDNGAWINTDFSEINFMVILEWESDIVIYIIPIENEVVENNATATLTNMPQSTNANIMTAEYIQPTLTIQEHFYINDTEITNNYEQQTIVANDELLAEYTITNSGSSPQSVDLILCIYNSAGRFINMAVSNASIAVGETKTVSRAMTVGSDIANCYAKVMLWDGLNTLRPLHDSIQIGEEGVTVETANAQVNCIENKEYNLIVTGENIPSNDNGIYTISYDPTKLELVDLCSLTYKKELTIGTIAGTSINVTSIDTTTGEIVFESPNASTQSISKVLNSFKFRGLVSNETTLITVN